MVIAVIGVSGSGKTTIGTLLADAKLRGDGDTRVEGIRTFWRQG